MARKKKEEPALDESFELDEGVGEVSPDKEGGSVQDLLDERTGRG